MREFIGTLINNFYLMNTRLTKLYLLAIPLVIALYLVSGNLQVGSLIPFFIVAATPTASLENAGVPFSTKWITFENTWGVAPYLMVLSRYVFVAIMTVICLGVWLIIPIDFHPLYGFNITLIHYVIAVLLMCAAYYPIAYLINPKQESMGIIITFISMAISYAATFGLHLAFGDNFLLQVAVIVAVFMVSISMSIALNAVHRGRVA